MMRALLIHEYRGPEVLQHADLPISEPSGGEALVRVKAVPVNSFLGSLTASARWSSCVPARRCPAPDPGRADRR
jgi:NADPH:quinone reductase-like Zn-dependent oxidoreductase